MAQHGLTNFQPGIRRSGWYQTKVFILVFGDWHATDARKGEGRFIDKFDWGFAVFLFMFKSNYKQCKENSSYSGSVCNLPKIICGL